MSKPQTITLHDILEKMIMEDQSGLDQMMHEYMVQRFQLAHERLLQEEDVELNEFALDSDDIKTDSSDIDAEETGEDEMYGDEDLTGHAEPDGDEEGGPSDFDGDEPDAQEEDGDVDKEDLMAALEKVEHDFQEIMSKIDTGEFENLDSENDSENDSEEDAEDLGSDEDIDNVEDTKNDEDLDSEEFGEGITEAKKVKKEKECEDDFDDLEESLTWSFDKATDPELEGNKLAGAGGSYKPNNKSPVVARDTNKRMGGTPVEIKSDEYEGYEWKNVAKSETMKPSKNTLGSSKKLYSEVKNTSQETEGTLAGSNAGKIQVNTKSPILQAKNVTESRKGKK